MASLHPTSRAVARGEVSVADSAGRIDSVATGAGVFQSAPSTHASAVAVALASQARLAGAVSSGALGSGASSTSGGVDMQGQGAATYADLFAQLKSGPLSHFDTQLSALYLQQHGAASAAGLVGLAAAGGSVQTGSDGRRYVTIDVTAKDGDGATLLHQLQGVGLIHGASFGSMASGQIAVDKLEALTHLGNLGFARESLMTTHAGQVTTQADIAERSNVARAEYGVDGSGLKVGVISDSMDASHSRDPVNHVRDTMQYDIDHGDLPTDTTILQDISGGTDEGRAMAQLVHDLAPGAAIQFATAYFGQANFAQNILALAANGADVIVDDVGYFNELSYQPGVIAQAIDQVVAGGVAYFSSAGNDGREGLEQAWRNGGQMTIGGMNERLMQFAPGQDYVPITLGAHTQVTIILEWDQPGSSAGGAGSADDLDLFVTNREGTKIISSSVDNNIGGDPVEYLGLVNDDDTAATAYIRVGLASGKAPGEIKIIASGNGYDVRLGDTPGNINDGTLTGHAGTSDAISVGAVVYNETPAYGDTVPLPESFTSGGPNRMWFDKDGHRLDSPFEHSGPQVSAVDGGNTTFFGYDYDSDGRPNFFGTSASAPDAAAVGVLMLSADHSLAAGDIENLLMDSAIDMDSPYTPKFDRGVDNLTGAGLIQADAAVRFATTHVIENDDARALYGTHLNDTIVGGSFSQMLVGGGGSDTFVYDAITDAPQVRPDTIRDLDNTDTIDVSAVDADDLRAGDQHFTEVARHHHHTAAEVVVRYHQTTDVTTFSFYTNKDSTVDMLIQAQGDHHDFTGLVT